MKNWVDGIPYEIAFWQGVYSNKKRIEGLFKWSKYNSEIELANFEVKDFLLQRENPIVIDAGCGMSFCNGDKLNGKPIDVRYIDPLAPFYNKIIERKKLNLPKITFGFIENLSSFLPTKVSLIIMQNALDHSRDPIKGVFECIDSLELGGALYLRHCKNEAEAENYCGFHQYNISLENDELIIWNKSEKNNINRILSDFTDIETSICEKEVIAIIKKKSELPKGLINRKKDIENLSLQYIDVLQNLNSTSYLLKYHFNFYKYQIVQLIAQRFNWETRQRIKLIIKKTQQKITIRSTNHN